MKGVSLCCVWKEGEFYHLYNMHIYIYIEEVCKSIFTWNSAQYAEAEQNKYYEREKGTQLHFLTSLFRELLHSYIYIYIYIQNSPSRGNKHF